ncbi:MAG: aminotransferase class I/II-fold pyridoxal phosphate-dependent enzyme [Rikenellaceae bacterium]
MISGHGNNIYQFDRQSIKADFSSNIAFNNHSHLILSHLSENMDALCNYPDPMATSLTARLASTYGVTPEEILVTNGSAEAFYLVAHYLGEGCRTAIVTPSFAEYEDSCRLHKHSISFIGFDELRSISLGDFDTLWLASPNNPDGKRIPIAQIEEIASKNRDCKIILDRAYNELSIDAERYCTLPSNVILIESFTKLYGVPGLRLGYIVASPEIIASLNTMRPPWSVNSLSLVAGEYILQHSEALQPDLRELIGESLYLQEAISLIGGYRVTPSGCNFFLVEMLNGRVAADLYRYLLEEHGLLIRDASNFRGLTPRHFRVAAQQRHLNDKLITALKEWR